MMISPVRQAIINRKKKVVLGVGIAACGLWLVLIMYFMMGGNKDNSVAQPGMVAVRSVSPVATPSTPARFSYAYKSPLRHSVAVPTPQWSILPAASMGSTSGSMHIYQTSSATVHSVGGGGSGGFGFATTSGHSSQGRGVSYTSVSYSGAIYVPIASNALTPVGASEAGDVSQQKLGAPQQRVRTTNDGEYPEDRPDPVEDEDTPIGDITWGLMLVLTIGWGVRGHRRRQQACK